MEYSINKNIITFDNEANKYEYDINTGICRNAKTKRELTYFFPHFTKFLNEQYYNAPNNFFGYLRHLTLEYDGKPNFAKLKKYQKSIQFAEVFFKNYKWEHWGTYPAIKNHYEILSKHFAELKDYFENSPHRYLSDIAQELEINDFVKKYNLNPNLPLQDKEDIMYVATSPMQTKFSKSEIINFCSRVIARGYRILFAHSIANRLINYIEVCEELNLPLGKVSDFASNYIDYINLRESRKNELDNKKLSAIKEKVESKLFYENEKFIVKVPSCIDDFVNESNNQHNCVYRSYLPYVLCGQRYIVFIRKKDNPSKSYITCEIYKDGRIGQYLGTFNHSVFDSDALIFQKDYQDFLFTNFLSN